MADSLPPSYADCLEIWEPQPPGTLRDCPGLYRDCPGLYTDCPALYRDCSALYRDCLTFRVLERNIEIYVQGDVYLGVQILKLIN
jgi:hypothetical protein